MPDSLFFVLKGAFQYRKSSYPDKAKYLEKLTNWPDLFYPNSAELLTKEKYRIEKELDTFKKDVTGIFTKLFSFPLPKPRSYQGFIFSALFLFECLRFQCPERRKNQFAVFSLLVFKSLLSACLQFPFEYSILKNIAYEYDGAKGLVKTARQQKDITDGPFLEKLFCAVNSEFSPAVEEGLDWNRSFKCPDQFGNHGWDFWGSFPSFGKIYKKCDLG